MTMLSVKPESGRLSFPSLSNMMESFFESEFPNLNRQDLFKTPVLVNIKDTKESYRIEVAAPGFKKEDFNINVEGGLLIIKAESKVATETNEERFTRKEFNFSSFTRNFTLPKTIEVNKVAASYEDGILSVVLPKKEEAKETPKMEVKVS